MFGLMQALTKDLVDSIFIANRREFLKIISRSILLSDYRNCYAECLLDRSILDYKTLTSPATLLLLHQGWRCKFYGLGQFMGALQHIQLHERE